MERVIFTNMCMISDAQGNVLIQERNDPDWPGATFPGGHVEPGESFLASVKREVWEETGLTVDHLNLCGVKWWLQEDGSRYVVLCYRTSHFSGTLHDSSEGTVRWVPLASFDRLQLASGMEYMIRLFTEEDTCEHRFDRSQGDWINIIE